MNRPTGFRNELYISKIQIGEGKKCEKGRELGCKRCWDYELHLHFLPPYVGIL